MSPRKSRQDSSAHRSRERAFGLMVRVAAHERSRFERCAGRLGLSVSAWMRMNLLGAAERQEMTEHGRPRP
jgi:hypothetical protein